MSGGVRETVEERGGDVVSPEFSFSWVPRWERQLWSHRINPALSQV